MKKITKLLALVLLICCLAVLLKECCMFYGGDSVTQGGVEYYSHSFLPECFAGAYTWEGESSQAVLAIPDSVDGNEVTSLGGYIGRGSPAAFMVVFPDIDRRVSESALPEEARIIDYHLELSIGANVRGMENVVMDDYLHLAGTDSYVRILVTVNCSEENPEFFSEDGKLYWKSDDSPVEGFFYACDFE